MTFPIHIGMKTLKIVACVVFACLVPWALYYNLNYDRFGVIDRSAPPVFIQVVTVDAGVVNNSLKSSAASYAQRNSATRIFVLPMTVEQIGTQEFAIRIIRDGNTLHCFVSPAQTKEALEHCQKFLQLITQELEGFQIQIK
jgi:hypothetical protein